MSSQLCLYILNKDGEAFCVEYFCSERCRNLQMEDFEPGPSHYSYEKGENTDAIEGTVCDYCCQELEA